MRTCDCWEFFSSFVCEHKGGCHSGGQSITANAPIVGGCIKSDGRRCSLAMERGGVKKGCDCTWRQRRGRNGGDALLLCYSPSP